MNTISNLPCPPCLPCLPSLPCPANNPAKKPANLTSRLAGLGILSIGAAGFEPTTSTTPKWRATKLRYAPVRIIIVSQRLGRIKGEV